MVYSVDLELVGLAVSYEKTILSYKIFVLSCKKSYLKLHAMKKL